MSIFLHEQRIPQFFLGTVLSVLGVGCVGTVGGAPDQNMAIQDASTATRADADADVMRDAGPTDATTSALLVDGHVSVSQPDGARPPPKMYPQGDPGCGLSAAAFCDTFDDVASAGLGESRAGELDPRVWAGERMQPGLNWGPAATPVRPATIPSCRDDLPARVFPNQDAVVCHGNDLLQSRHLLTAAAEQSYGQLSMRIRKPFDFRDRTGTVVFDVEGETTGFLRGWVGIAITEEPSPAPSFGILQNFENGAVPRNGVEIQLFDGCSSEHKVGVAHVNVFRDYAETYYSGSEGGRSPTCVQTQVGALNHFEVRISRTHMEVWGSDRSLNGHDFPAMRRIFQLDVELPFDRGYVHLNTHNHSSLKYSEGRMDAVTARWDNVGFDGPVVAERREYSVADALDPVTVDNSTCMNIGYQLHTEAEGPAQKLIIPGVDKNVTNAHLALNGHFNMLAGSNVTDYVLKYRLNGGTWQEHRFDAAQLALIRGPVVYNEAGTQREATGISGTMALFLEVDPKTLIAGDNTLEFVTLNVPTSYRAYVANIDLITDVP
jgi:hypothetical protein